MTELRRGKKPAKQTALKFASDYLVEPFPTPPASADVTGGISPVGWGMLGNGPDPTLTLNGGSPVGDCYFAARQHVRMAKAAVRGTLTTEPWETSNQLVAEYLAYDNGVDEGVVIADALQANYLSGKIRGYAKLDITNRAELYGGMIAGHGVLLGVMLPSDAETQFEAGQEWHVSGPPDPNDGHVVSLVTYDDIAKTRGVVTWSKLWICTLDFITTYADEAYLVMTDEDEGWDWNAIDADLRTLGGEEPPLVQPPGPAPIPPAPFTVPPTHESWWSELREWITAAEHWIEHHV